MSTLSINKHYNFSVYANAVLGSFYSDAKLVSVLDYRIALKFANVELLHRQVYPYLPPNTPSDHQQYTYYLFSYRGKDVVLADVWILPSSIEETQGLSYTITLHNVTNADVAIVRDQLRLLGLSFDVASVPST